VPKVNPGSTTRLVAPPRSDVGECRRLYAGTPEYPTVLVRVIGKR
jgi:hypothetical protein